MLVSLQRTCLNPSCRASGTREFTRSKPVLPWFHRVYICLKCRYSFKGMKLLLVRIAWGVRPQQQVTGQAEDLLPAPARKASA